MIKIEVTNPHSHTSRELLMLAQVLADIAKDVHQHGQVQRTATASAPLPPGAVQRTEQVGDVSLTTTVVPPAANAEDADLMAKARQAFGGSAPATAPLDSTPGAATVPPASDTTPPANVPPAPTSTASGELDSAGMPWDARIHGEAKTKNKDLTWKYRKNLDRSIVPAIEAENRALLAANASAGTPPPAPTEYAPGDTARNANPSAGAVAQGGAAVTPPPPPPAATAPATEQPAPPPPPPAAGATVAPGDIFRRITQLQELGKLTPDMLVMVLAESNLKGMMEVTKITPEGRAKVLADLEAVCA